MELALGDGAVAEEARGDASFAVQLVGQGQADGDRQAAADDRVSRRRSAAPTSNKCIDPPRPRLQPFALPYISAMSAPARHAAGERVAVLAIGGDDFVVRAEACIAPTATASSPI